MNAMSINILVNFVVVIIAIACILSCILLYTSYKLKKEANRLVEYSINVNAVIDEQISQILDNMIEECFDEYMILNKAYKDKGYINSEEEIEIMKEIGNMVVERLSPAAIDKLSLFYNIDSITQIISNKVYILVMAHTAQNNQIPDEKIEI